MTRDGGLGGTRRRFLGRAAGAASVAFAGCSLIETRTHGGGRTDIASTATPEDDGASTDADFVYLPPHVHGHRVAETVETNGLGVGLLYSVPDLYFRVNGSQTTEVTAAPDDSMQLLTWVWDVETRTVLQGVPVRADVRNGDGTVVDDRLIPLLSQRRGAHQVRNVSLPTYGEYSVRLTLAPPEPRLTGAFGERFTDTTTVELALPYDRETMESIETTFIKQSGKRGAVKPMDADAVPLSVQPPAAESSQPTATGTSGQAKLRVSGLTAEESPLSDGRSYLELVATTPMNRYVLPHMQVTATVSRDGTQVFDGRLRPTIDPQRGYHYGADVDSIEPTDVVTVSITHPPQIARFTGYEQAFLEMPDAELTLR